MKVKTEKIIGYLLVVMMVCCIHTTTAIAKIVMPDIGVEYDSTRKRGYNLLGFKNMEAGYNMAGYVVDELAGYSNQVAPRFLGRIFQVYTYSILSDILMVSGHEGAHAVAGDWDGYYGQKINIHPLKNKPNLNLFFPWKRRTLRTWTQMGYSSTGETSGKWRVKTWSDYKKKMETRWKIVAAGINWSSNSADRMITDYLGFNFDIGKLLLFKNLNANGVSHTDEDKGDIEQWAYSIAYTHKTSKHQLKNDVRLGQRFQWAGMLAPTYAIIDYLVRGKTYRLNFYVNPQYEFTGRGVKYNLFLYKLFENGIVGKVVGGYGADRVSGGSLHGGEIGFSKIPLLRTIFGHLIGGIRGGYNKVGKVSHNAGLSLENIFRNGYFFGVDIDFYSKGHNRYKPVADDPMNILKLRGGIYF